MSEEKPQEFVIEKGVPMPPKHDRSRYPFAKMEVGDCFWTGKPLHAAAQSAYYHGHKLGMKFSCRKHFQGTRVWRIK